MAAAKGFASMTTRVALLFLVLLLAGCSGGGSDDAPAQVQGSPPAVVETVQASYDDATGAVLTTSRGHVLTVPAGSLSGDTTLSLDVLAGPLDEPENPDFDAVGQYLDLEIGAVQITGPIQVEMEDVSGGRASVAVHRGDLFLPMETEGVGGRLRATVPDLDEVAALQEDAAGSDLLVGVVDETDYWLRPPHRPWGSYNLYVWNGRGFTKAVHQGVGTWPDLGERPLMLVHGLGSSVGSGRFDAVARYLVRTGQYTSVVGFEYDTLSPVAGNGTLLGQAMGVRPTQTWRHMAHSMGSLVTRFAYEKAGPAVAGSGNRVVTVCGPHAGSPMITAIQDGPNLVQRAVLYLILNGVMEFSNADGRACLVTGMEQGFTDLRVGSPFLVNLNAGAGVHPQVEYSTLGGNARGVQFNFLNFIAFGFNFSKYLDDGLVDLGSANPRPTNPPPYQLDIGARFQEVLPVTHTSALDERSAHAAIQSLLTR